MQNKSRMKPKVNMKEITVDLTIRVVIETAEGENTDTILHNMDYDFAWQEDNAYTTKTEMLNQEIVEEKIVER